ncbi:MAG TPA: hypothetical protein VGX71_26715 [Pseudaminobacter sp.]|nr:hypothetical protein [Pseudaminobacter sp.]
MSRHEEELMLQLSLAESLSACDRAASGSGWRVTARQATSIRCIETSQNAFGFTNPAQVTIALTETGDSTRVMLSASNFGFGPIQSKHVREQAKQLSRQIETEASRSVEPEAPPIESIRSVYINDKQLSDEQLLSIEQAYRVRVPDGRYWYDPVSGAWGVNGGPQSGIAVAGLALGGPLRADASNGNTGVLVNGRELHALDVAALTALVGNVIPGRWWVDSLGNFGPDGWPMVGNLFMIARSRNATGSSGGGSSQYGSLVSEGGFIGFQGSIGSGVSASIDR